MRASTKRDLERQFSVEPDIEESFPGGNSIVHKVKLDTTSVAVKEYTGNADRISRSLRREASALKFLNSSSVLSVPRIIYVSEKLGFTVMNFINGETPRANRQTLQAMLDFTQSLRLLFLRDSSFTFAVDASTNLMQLNNQIHERLYQAKNTSQEYFPQITYVLEQLSKNSGIKNIDHQLTYSVSDLGIHNVLFHGKRYHFFDFEFFGKDSPYKMVGDFLLHPQNRFSKTDNEYFLEKSLSLFSLDRDQLGYMIGYLATKWSLICIKRLESLRDSSSTSDVIRSQDKLIRYYLNMAEIFSQVSELNLLFDNEGFFP